MTIPDLQDGHFVLRHAQCRLCTEMDYVWCPRASSDKNWTAADTDGACVDPADELCPKTGITVSSKCPGDAPRTKQSCTLCTLDSYTWCPDFSGVLTDMNEYEGHCRASGPCPKQVDPPKTWPHDHHHWNHHHDKHRHKFLENGIQDTGLCKLDDSRTLTMMAVGLASAGLWIATVGTILFCLLGSLVAVCAWRMLTSKRTTDCCKRMRDIIYKARNHYMPANSGDSEAEDTELATLASEADENKASAPSLNRENDTDGGQNENESKLYPEVKALSSSYNRLV